MPYAFVASTQRFVYDDVVYSLLFFATLVAVHVVEADFAIAWVRLLQHNDNIMK